MVVIDDIFINIDIDIINVNIDHDTELIIINTANFILRQSKECCPIFRPCEPLTCSHVVVTSLKQDIANISARSNMVKFIVEKHFQVQKLYVTTL